MRRHPTLALSGIGALMLLAVLFAFVLEESSPTAVARTFEGGAFGRGRQPAVPPLPADAAPLPVSSEVRPDACPGGPDDLR